MIIGYSLVMWARLVGDYTQDGKLANQLLKELVKKYSSAGRHYHNWKHIEHLITVSDEFQNHLQHRRLVNFSIFYHDVVYNVFRKDNEQKSAAFAEKRLQKIGMPAEEIAIVKFFIEATQTHQVPENYPYASDLALFLDFDMSILGAAPDDYRIYSGQLRKEYRLIPGSMYKAGRKKFLEGCLQSPFIFHTPVFREKYEAAARQNIREELTRYQ